jgi:hypothetical protein
MTPVHAENCAIIEAGSFHLPPTQKHVTEGMSSYELLPAPCGKDKDLIFSVAAGELLGCSRRGRGLEFQGHSIWSLVVPLKRFLVVLPVEAWRLNKTLWVFDGTWLCLFSNVKNGRSIAELSLRVICLVCSFNPKHTKGPWHSIPYLVV